MQIDFLAAAQALRAELVARRRDFHRHPELAFEEVRTARIVAEELTALGLEVQTGIGKTGVIGILEGDQDGPTVLLRADMDALPIEEANATEYISTVPGIMHACGHDGHTAIALGVAKLLADKRDQIAGRIKFVFQPAEEVGGGAQAMVNDGALRNPAPDVSLGLHLWNTMPVGTIGLADGPVMAAVSDFVIHIHGRGGHGALPHETVDPVVCAAQIVTALQTIVSRNSDPLDTAVVSVTQIHTGSANNIIPPSAKMTGTFRTFTHETRDMVAKRIREIAEGIASAMGCTIEADIQHYTEAVVNHPDVAQRLRDLFNRIPRPPMPIVEERTMGGEDVGVFMTDVPGAYFFLGSGNEERDLSYPHHHPRFDFDEDVLPLGVGLLAAAVADYLLVQPEDSTDG